MARAGGIKEASASASAAFDIGFEERFQNMKRPTSLAGRRGAVLLIDFQEEQRSDPLYAVAGFEAALANAQRLLTCARQHHIPVFHAAYRRDFTLAPQRPFEPVSADGTAHFSDAGNPATAICPEVLPQDGEVTLFKNDASAFGDGRLHAALRAAETEWLVVAGVWSEACVAASVRDAMAAGLRVLLVKDACGSGTRAMHEVAILNLANRLYGGAVADAERACALMEGKPAMVWVTERPVPILFDYETAEHHYRAL
jgi:maleamate amidohydrolase